MITSAQITARGGRAENEDTVRIRTLPAGICAVVADGLGGHGGGQTASRTAAESFLSDYEAENLQGAENLYHAFEHAGQKVRDRQTKRCVMKTTAVVLTIAGGRAAWGHVGDSRLYHFADGRLTHQTMDHSVSQMAVLMGDITPDQIRFHEDRNRVLRALGSENWKPDIVTDICVEEGAHAFLLCTDGFWEYVYEEEMEKTLAAAKTPQEWLAAMERLLLERVKEGNDNYTAAAVFCGA